MAAGDKEVISFKADPEMARALKDISNRSEFIRSAVAAALEGTRPLCQGSGTLSPEQKQHWAAFRRNHSLRRCDDCHALHLVCLERDGREARGSGSK